VTTLSNQASKHFTDYRVTILSRASGLVVTLRANIYIQNVHIQVVTNASEKQFILCKKKVDK